MTGLLNRETGVLIAEVDVAHLPEAFDRVAARRGDRPPWAPWQQPLAGQAGRHCVLRLEHDDVERLLATRLEQVHMPWEGTARVPRPLE